MSGQRSSVRVIKVFGERNSGTNYLTELCQQNLDSEVIPGILPTWWRRAQQLAPGEDAVRDLYFTLSAPWKFGWKHREVDVRILQRSRRARHVHFVAIAKNPYSWLVSLARRPHHLPFPEGGPVRALCCTPIPTLRREGGPTAYENAIDMWNRKTKSYLVLRDAFPTTIVRYEDLLSSPEPLIEQISRRSGAARLSDAFANVEESTKQPGTSNTDYRTYYGEERWRDALDPSDIDLISSSIDADLMLELEYEIL